MNFLPTEDRRMLADSLNRFFAEQYDCVARGAICRSAEGYRPAVWQPLAELGALGAMFRAEQGGLGGAGFDLAVVFEAAGRALVVEPLLATLMAGEAIALAGNSAQQQILTAMLDGKTLAAFAHEEPGGHYETDHVVTRVEPHHGGWLLNGAKAAVLAGARANVFVVSAVSDAGAGQSLFLVPARAAGLSVQDQALIDGGRAAELRFDGVELGPDALLGNLSAAGPVLESVLGRGVLALCAEAVGVMDVMRAHTVEYLRTRKQFGVPIGSFQALQHRMADVLLEIEQARSAVINAAAALDGERLARERALSAAKFSIGRIGNRVAEESIQLHGGIAMTWDLPLAHYAKRLVMIDHQLGDEDHHLQRFIDLGLEAAREAGA